MRFVHLLSVCAFLALTTATQVRQCPGMKVDDLASRVELTSCTKQPCTLKIGSSQHLTIRFTPEEDIVDLKNYVTADLVGLPVPYVGVSGYSVCGKIQNEAGEKVDCPLKQGITYLYTDSFPVISPTPLVTKVHWALQNEHEKDVICFEVMANIKY